MRIANGALIMQGDAFKKAAVPCCCAVLTQRRCRDVRFMQGRRSGRPLLTDPMPESATESLPESVVCVFLLGSESVFPALPPTGQSILAVILLLTVPF